MVKLRQPTRTRAAVVKSARVRRPRCVVCGATLASDHALGDLICGAHPHDGYNPRHDAHLAEHILILLLRAGGEPLNLYRALGCELNDTNRNAVHVAVKRLNATGFVRIRGHLRVGYELTTLRRAPGVG